MGSVRPSFSTNSSIPRRHYLGKTRHGPVAHSIRGLPTPTILQTLFRANSFRGSMLCSFGAPTQGENDCDTSTSETQNLPRMELLAMLFLGLSVYPCLLDLLHRPRLHRQQPQMDPRNPNRCRGPSAPPPRGVPPLMGMSQPPY